MHTPRGFFGRLLTVLAVLSTATALVAGCSGSKKSSAPLPDASKLVQESAQTTKNVKSVHMVLIVKGKIKGLPVKTLKGDLSTSPTAAKGNATITFSGSDIDAEFVVIDGTLYAALSAGKWDDFGPAADIYDPSGILNPDTGLANMLSKLTDTKSVARENLNGQTTIKVTGKAPVDAVNGLAPQLKPTQPLPATVWIQETGQHQLVQAELEQSQGNSVQMTLSNWGAPVSVTKPPVS